MPHLTCFQECSQIWHSSHSSHADTSDCRHGCFFYPCQSYSVFSQESNPPQARRSPDLELVLQTIYQKPGAVICDDDKTQFQDFASKLTTTLALKVKIQNFAWFVFDGELPEALAYPWLCCFQYYVRQLSSSPLAQHPLRATLMAGVNRWSCSSYSVPASISRRNSRIQEFKYTRGYRWLLQVSAGVVNRLPGVPIAHIDAPLLNTQATMGQVCFSAISANRACHYGLRWSKSKSP
mmetsp:Transcript_109103/g.185115  ORF Transcript_109103/g.185115 Transcript_109103/m.185115 type:complete len:236 (+) Transcript_109103:121-828(+)